MAVYNAIHGRWDNTIITDSDNYGPPVYGGAVNVRSGSVSYTQEGVTAYLFTLPKGAEIVSWQIVVATAFNDSGTDLLDIGDDTTANRFANDVSLASAGTISTGWDAEEMFTPLTADTTFLATYTGENNNASAGACTVVVSFIIR
jgi:hypothetical protein